jgi:hypothetical protein
MKDKIKSEVTSKQQATREQYKRDMIQAAEGIPAQPTQLPIPAVISAAQVSSYDSPSHTPSWHRKSKPPSPNISRNISSTPIHPEATRIAQPVATPLPTLTLAGPPPKPLPREQPVQPLNVPIVLPQEPRVAAPLQSQPVVTTQPVATEPRRLSTFADPNIERRATSKPNTTTSIPSAPTQATSSPLRTSQPSTGSLESETFDATDAILASAGLALVLTEIWRRHKKKKVVS